MFFFKFKGYSGETQCQKHQESQKQTLFEGLRGGRVQQPMFRCLFGRYYFAPESTHGSGLRFKALGTLSGKHSQDLLSGSLGGLW